MPTEASGERVQEKDKGTPNFKNDNITAKTGSQTPKKKNYEKQPEQLKLSPMNTKKSELALQEWNNYKGFMADEQLFSVPLSSPDKKFRVQD